MQWCSSMPWLRYAVEQRLILAQLYFKSESAGKCHRKFQCHFPGNHFQVNKFGQSAENNGIAGVQKGQQEMNYADRREIGHYSC